MQAFDLFYNHYNSWYRGILIHFPSYYSHKIILLSEVFIFDEVQYFSFKAIINLFMHPGIRYFE